MSIEAEIQNALRGVIPEIGEYILSKLLLEKIVPSPEEKVYTKQEAKELYLTDARFKKISNGFLRDAEARGDLVNIGTEYRRKYKESNLLSAMAKKGRKIRFD